jgi:hypothetical protein
MVGGGAAAGGAIMGAAAAMRGIGPVSGRTRMAFRLDGWLICTTLASNAYTKLLNSFTNTIIG